MKKLLTASILSIGAFVSFQTLSSQIVNIPDANFKAFLVGNSSINTNLDAEIQVTEAAAYNGSIFAGTQGIADLTGIEAFTALTVLDVSQNNLSSIDLSANTALISVNVTYNSLTCLDLSSDTALVTLDCSYNMLSSLNLKNGNYTHINSVSSLGNSMLFCIQVDSVAYSLSNWFGSTDTWSTFNTNCGQPTALFTANDPVCFGTAVSFSNSSIAATSFSWDFGDASGSSLATPAHTYAVGGAYTVILSVSNCNGTDTVSAIVEQGVDVLGNVSYSGGPVTSGTAIIYQYQPFFISFDTVQIQNLDAAGNYHFTNIIDGNYIVKVFPDTGLFPTLVPTYFGNHWAWDSAAVINQNCITDYSGGISMVENTGIGGGIGLLQGHIIEGMGFGRSPGDPVHGVDVKLGVTGSPNIAAYTETDNNGVFTFSGVPFGTYTVYVDIPGLERDSSYTVVVDASTNQFTNLDYLADSVAIYILPNFGIEDNVDSNPFKFSIYPNPVKDLTNINYTIYSDSKVRIDVYNMVGAKVQSLINVNQQAGQYMLAFNTKVNNLNPGIYLISLTANNKTQIMRIIIMD